MSTSQTDLIVQPLISKNVITNVKCSDPLYRVELPGLEPLTSRDLPSFLVPSNAYAFVLSLFAEQLEMLNKETNPKILVNTFDALEHRALKVIDKFNMIGIGPLLPSAILDGNDPSDTCFGADLFQNSKTSYKEWLNSQPKSSVVYVSFGSICILSKKQTEEIARGLLKSNRPFLWVIREDPNKKQEEEDGDISCRKELEEKGMIVPWCDQVEVLSNQSLGCFISHCGWNSTLESLVSGVPVVAFPQWTDQGTNAKLIEDDWEIGVRVVPNEEGIVEGEEITRCLDLVMGDGEKGKDVRKNAKKWKDLAREAVKESGSSDKNLKAFVDEVLS
ncbi:crocetin glucosyltransferase, chloroplastic [Jatropha curcas]|uniref:crocetin glucosyltransferase, chloroplastic n=1 Tax=Jatropha curcas TaxID=180498 RepID=UPI001895CBD5|nr:crocetin glucosyltransferase, chloroplastic [Jatropha curcas]